MCQRQDDEILSASEELGLNIAPVRRIQQLCNGKIFDDFTDQQTTCVEFMTTVWQAASMADQLETQTQLLSWK